MHPAGYGLYEDGAENLWPDLIDPPLFPSWFTKGYGPDWAGTQNWTGYFYSTESRDEYGFATDQSQDALTGASSLSTSHS